VARSLRQMGVKAFVFGVTGNALEEVRLPVSCLLANRPSYLFSAIAARAMNAQ